MKEHIQNLLSKSEYKLLNDKFNAVIAQWITHLMNHDKDRMTVSGLMIIELETCQVHAELRGLLFNPLLHTDFLQVQIVEVKIFCNPPCIEHFRITTEMEMEAFLQVAKNIIAE